MPRVPQAIDGNRVRLHPHVVAYMGTAVPADELAVVRWLTQPRIPSSAKARSRRAGACGEERHPMNGDSMHHRLIGFSTAVLPLALLGCSGNQASGVLTCGAGTTVKDGQCRPIGATDDSGEVDGSPGDAGGQRDDGSVSDGLPSDATVTDVANGGDSNHGPAPHRCGQRRGRPRPWPGRRSLPGHVAASVVGRLLGRGCPRPDGGLPHPSCDGDGGASLLCPTYVPGDLMYTPSLGVVVPQTDLVIRTPIVVDATCEQISSQEAARTMAVRPRRLPWDSTS